MSFLLKIVTKISNQQIILPFYHLAVNKPPKFIKHLYLPKNINQFINDLHVLLKHYHPISLEELILINQGKKQMIKPSFHLTFDDGLSNFYNVVAPILIKKKIPATVFLNTNFVDNKALFYRYKASLLIDHYLNASKKTKETYIGFINKENKEQQKDNSDEFVTKFLLNINFHNKDLLDKLAVRVNFSFTNFLEKEKPYLNLKQIKVLQKQDFTFGTHSKNHPFYADLSLEKQLKQTNESIDWLQENLDIKYKVFSFPFSDAHVSKAFFKNISLDLSFGTFGLKKDIIPTNLQRLDMEKLDTNSNFFLIKEHLKYILKIPFGKSIFKRN